MSDVFISYSRKDIAFSRLIQEALQNSQIDTWIDWERIPVGERWWDEICAAIENANVFMLIISKSSIGSLVCKDEINHALKNNKRIIPILVDNVRPDEIMEFVPDLPQFNWIIFQKDHIFRIEKNPMILSDKPEDSLVALPKLPQFEEALQKLSQAIHTDWEWVKYHTRFQLDALRWEINKRNPSYLVQGLALEDAEQTLLSSVGKDPQPTGLQVEYLTASRQEDTRRQSEMLNLEQKARRRQRFVIWAVGLGLTVAVVLGMIAWGQRNQYLSETHVRATAEANAINQRATAEAANILAIEQRNEAEHQAKLALSGQLSVQSQSQLTHNLDLAMLLAAESFLTEDTYNTRSSLLLALEQSPQLARIFRYPDKINSLAFSPDEKMLAAAGCSQRDEQQDACLQNSIIFYDLESGAETGRVLNAPAGRLTGLAFTPNGATLFAAIAGDRIYRYDLSAAGQPAPEPLPVYANSSAMLVISPDGKSMASGGCYMFSMPGGACSGGGLVLWDLSRGEPSGTALEGVGAGMHNLAFNPEGSLLFAGDCANLQDDRCVKGEVKTWTLPEGAMQKNILESTTSAIVSVDVSADGKLLAAGEAAGIVHIINLENWKQVGTHTQGLEINSLLFSRSGSDQMLASLSLGDPLEVFSATNSRDDFFLEPYQTTRFIDAMAISPDGRFLASSACAVPGEYQACSLEQIYLWNLVSWQPVAQVFGSGGPSQWNYWQVGFDPSSPQKPIVVAASADEIVLWDVEKNQPEEQPFINSPDLDFTNMSLSHSGKILAYSELIGYVESDRMYFWDVATRQAIAAPVLVDGWILHLNFSPDDRWMVTDGPEDTFLVWDPTTGQIVRQISPTVLPDGHIQQAFSPDGKNLAIAGCILSEGNKPCENYRIELYDLETGKSVGKPLDGLMHGVVNRLEFSPDGRKIGINTSIDPVDTWWDIESGQTDPILENTAVVWLRSPDGRYSISVDCEIGNNSSCGVGLITLWDVQKGAPIGQPIRSPDEKLNILGFSPDGKFLYTSGIGKMTVWSLDPQDWLARLCRVANRNFSPAEWSFYFDTAPYHATCALAPEE